MISREQILVAIPAGDSKIDCGCVMGLMMCLEYYHRPLFYGGCSNIQFARNSIAHRFMEETSYEWVMMIDSDIQFTREDWLILWEGDEKIVIGDYSKKKLGEASAKHGLGFTRVHRSVFEKIKELKNEAGEDMARRYYHKGTLMVDYFPQGAIGAGEWIGEDQGFLMWCANVENNIRWEIRMHLKHVGRFEYGYPVQLPGYTKDEEGAQ